MLYPARVRLAASNPDAAGRWLEMALKSFNPYTASRRFITVLDKSEITKQTPEKSLLEPKPRSAPAGGIRMAR